MSPYIRAAATEFDTFFRGDMAQQLAADDSDCPPVHQPSSRHTSPTIRVSDDNEFPLGTSRSGPTCQKKRDGLQVHTPDRVLTLRAAQEWCYSLSSAT